MRTVFATILGVTLLFAVAFAGFFLYFDDERLQALAQDTLAGEPQTELSIGSLARSVGLAPRITAHEVELRSHGEDAGFALFAANKVAFSIELWKLPLGKVSLREIDVDRPILHFPVDESNRLPQWAPLFRKFSRWSRNAKWSAESFAANDIRVSSERPDADARAQLQAERLTGAASSLAALELAIDNARVALETMLPAQPFSTLEIEQLTVHQTDDDLPVQLLIAGTIDGQAFSFDGAGENLAAGAHDAADRVRAEARLGAWRLNTEGEVRLRGNPKVAVQFDLRDTNDSDPSRNASGHLNYVSQSERPLIAGDIEIGRLAYDNSEASASGSSVSGRKDLLGGVLPVLDKLDLDVGLRVDQLSISEFKLQDLKADLKLDAGRLVIDPAKMRFFDGNADGRIEVERTAKSTRIAVDARLDHMRAAAALEALGVSKDLAAGIEGSFALRSRGDSIGAWLDNASGDLTLVANDGRLATALTEMLDADLLEMFLSSNDADETTPIRCAVVDLQGSDGKFGTDILVVDTGELKLIGDGALYLDQGRIDLRLVPHGKDFNLLSASAPLEIKGSLSSPEATVAKGAALASLLTPFELGSVSNANCQSLIEAATENAQKNTAAAIAGR